MAQSLWVRSKAVFPICSQLASYRSDWLRRDVTAGLAIAAVALPIGVAYPAIAGLPPEVGLYASILSLLGYAIFGSSRQLIVGPDAATLTILGASLSQVVAAGAEQQRIIAAAAFAVAVGIVCLLAGVLRLGFLANFLSRPILTGYLCGISLTLLVGQIGRLTTVTLQSKGLLRPLIELSGKLALIHAPTLFLGMGIFVLLRLLRWWSPRSPGPLIAVVLGILLSYVFNLELAGISLVGKVPAILPSLSLPMPQGVDLGDLVQDALGIFIVSFGSGIITARSFGARNRYRVDTNRELFGFGAANIASGLFGGFPVTGADSRTAINDAVGGRTQVAGLVAAAALICVLVALTDVMKYLPVTVLGAVIASAALDLFDAKGLRRLWQTSHVEFLFALIAMLGVIGFGVLEGVLIAIVATAAYLLARVSHPRDALLGRIPGQDIFYKLHREPRAKTVPGLAVYLVEGSLVFFNVDYVKDRIGWIADRLPPSTRWFILDAGAVATIDSTAAAMLGEINEEFSRRDLRLGLANLHAQPRELLSRSGLLASIGSGMLFARVEDAALAFERTSVGVQKPGSPLVPR
jgi:sulfate permease, SulP family